MQTPKNVASLAVPATRVCGCSADRPVLYPNEAMQRTGSDAAQRQVDECMRLADAYLQGGGTQGKAATEVAGRTVGGAVVGGCYFSRG